jgi:predicted enzyme related to lactoylglutathione lyase
MSEQAPLEPGTIAWTDLTIPDADGLRDFYSKVLGWSYTPVEMGEYSDYAMQAQPSGTTVAGICHARGVNAGLPPQWLLYVIVEDLDDAARQCRELGGAVIVEPGAMGSSGRFCVIRDPAGAVMALYTPAEKAGA